MLAAVGGALRRAGCGDRYEIAHGTRAVDIMRTLRPGVSDDEVAEGLRLIEDMEIDDVADLKVLPGVRELLGVAAAGAVDDCDLGDAAADAGPVEGGGAAVAGAS